MRSSNSVLWRYFDKQEQGTYLATCKICDNDFSYFSTTHNLRSHLVRRHNIEIDEIDIDSIEKVINDRKSTFVDKFNRNELSLVSRKNPSWVWQVFKRKSAHSATCQLCGDDFKYTTSTTNLSKHIERAHPLAYEQLRQADKDTKKDDEDVSFIFEAQDDDSNSSLQQQDIYFEECDGHIKCTVCKKNISEDGEDPRGHLEEHHPGLLARIIKNEEKTEEGNTLQDDNDNDNADKDIFTEVIYLDPIPETKPSYKRKFVDKSLSNQSNQSKKRHLSPPLERDDFTTTIKAKESPSELDSFLGYITVLLKKLPTDVCSRVQLDIINLIMTAQFNLSSTSTSSLVQAQAIPNATVAVVANTSNDLDDSNNVQNSM